MMSSGRILTQFLYLRGTDILKKYLLIFYVNYSMTETVTLAEVVAHYANGKVKKAHLIFVLSTSIKRRENREEIKQSLWKSCLNNGLKWLLLAFSFVTHNNDKGNEMSQSKPFFFFFYIKHLL